MADPKPERRRPKSIEQALIDNAPWLPIQTELRTAAALRALRDGTATSDQQKFVLAWFINEACRTYDLSFRPGAEEGARDTVFAEGRRFPGLQVVKHLNANLDRLKRGGST